MTDKERLVFLMKEFGLKTFQLNSNDVMIGGDRLSTAEGNEEMIITFKFDSNGKFKNALIS